MTVPPLHVNGITIAPQAEIRLADLQRPIAIREYMRELFEYGRLTEYRCDGGETRRLPDGRETGALARRLPAALPAVSGSASRFLTRWDLLGSVLLPINTGFAAFSALARTDYESAALPTELRWHISRIDDLRGCTTHVLILVVTVVVRSPVRRAPFESSRLHDSPNQSAYLAAVAASRRRRVGPRRRRSG